MPCGAGRLEELCDHFVQLVAAWRGLISRASAHIHTAAFANFDPATAIQFAIGGADGIRMNAKAARQLAGAGQFLSYFQIAADYSEPNLSDQLLASTDFATS